MKRGDKRIQDETSGEDTKGDRTVDQIMMMTVNGKPQSKLLSKDT